MELTEKFLNSVSCSKSVSLKSLPDGLQFSAHFLGPLFVPAAVVLPPFLGVTLRFVGLGERFGPAEVVDPDFFLAASTNALFVLMISSSWLIA